ncbi:MAG: MFS transporter [Deltaproteobacteria bacterium]|nr:MFS transporter [Deltaproteobacteria bacterium]
MPQNEVTAGTSEAAVSSAVTGSAAEEPSPSQKTFILGLVCSSHTLNHIQSGVTSVLFPAMMKDLGFGYLQLGILSAVHHFSAQGLQVVYGFLAAFMKRAVILGVGNTILGVSVFVHAFLGSYGQLLGARVFSSVGASAQNPMGASILSGYFPAARGRALMMHHTAGNVGSFLAPAIAASLLLIMGWRQVFLVLGAPSILMGVCYFLLRDRVPSSARMGKKKTAKAGLDAYWKCLKNRNIVFTAMILMVGAAGRGTGFNVAYLVPYFMSRFDLTASQAGFLLMVLEAAGVAGPLAVAWVSDRVGRRALVVQSTLLLSALFTVWLAHQTSIGVLLFINLILYGTFVQARGTLTQAMIGDFATDDIADAAFSLYYFIGFMSGPFWTLLSGFVLDRYGFTPAFYLAGASYILGMILLALVGGRKSSPMSADA